ncbi:MAG: bifunctional UDP-N-acetylglucosamine diphosphorylase/glucosamine-1-phosphate N-acetyltransferase GlmU [Streptococcaceae bacterium]|jgi:bifunctional UDP-N-acetylglucosamine pyrophosphorylase/glucosamine-1-phosphate N-acetyltransferase|nr:bifunctional UDP-N-acetylglucosamine diphosphorylase/glucosamine-1-phosphate N-acetyltransferase GlmU [Streptococcaceae bacterium]
MDKYIVILAAGKGTRMKSDLPKVLHKVAGKSMLEHVVAATEAIDAQRRVVVVGHGREAVVDSLPDSVSMWVEQTEQKGTGHAVLETQGILGALNGATMVTYGDMPLITSETLEALFAYHAAENAAATILTSIAADPFGYGRIIRENGAVKKIVEEKDATADERAIHEVNTGIGIFDNKLLFEALENLTPSNAQGEYYLTDVIGAFVAADRKVSAMILENFDESLGVNDRVQLATAEKTMRQRINEKLMLSGVTLLDPATTYIDAAVKIGAETVIEGGVTLRGRTEIGKNCLITQGSRIENSRLENRVIVSNSTVENSVMESGSNCGPYAHLRPGTILHEKVHVGNFVEVKNATLGDGTKAGHLTYIGDATVGKKVNFGAGTVIVNYDGKNKYRSEIDDFAFVGSGTRLISPVTIGKNALTAAGSVITEDVPEDSVAFGRARQANKLGLAKKMPYYKGE